MAAARTATAPKTAQKAQRELEDLQLVLKARNGSQAALDQLLRRYHGFVRLKASSYFLADLRAEGHSERQPSRVRDRLDDEMRAKLERLRRGK